MGSSPAAPAGTRSGFLSQGYIPQLVRARYRPQASLHGLQRQADRDLPGLVRPLAQQAVRRRIRKSDYAKCALSWPEQVP